MKTLAVGVGVLVVGLMSFAQNAHAKRTGGIETESRTISLNNSMTASEIQDRIDSVGKYIPPEVTITFQFADGTYSGLNSCLVFVGFYGGGAINVYGHIGEAGSGALHVNQNVVLDFSGGSSIGMYFGGNSVKISVQDIRVRISDTAQVGGIVVTGYAANGSSVKGCYVVGSGKTSVNFGIRAQSVHVQFVNNYVSNVHYGIAAELMALVYSNNNEATGTLPNYGLYSGMASTIGKDFGQPSGSIANELVSGGGRISP